ncbi:MAG TPA: hypothetical protein VF266_19120 [Thermoanaerobaculia bacterium]
MRLLAIILSCVLGGAAGATQRFLVPIHLVEPVNGDAGSRWASELTVLNTGTTGAYIENYGTCAPTGGPCIYPLFPRVAESGTPVRDVSFTIPAAMLIVEDQYVDQLVFSARVRDLSRNTQSWGTWLPVVPESAAVHGTLTLLDVPISAGFRQTLRVYSFDIANGRSVLVRVYGAVAPDPANPTTYTQPNPLLGETVLPLRRAEGLRAAPLYAEIGNLATIANVTGYDKVWLTIEPQGAFGVWGMVSITNNTTQEVTMIVPHRSH